MAWTWTFHDAAGTDLALDAAPSLTATEFPTQADAESWVGEVWQELAADGVDAVTLVNDGAKVYGPMSLRAAE